MSWSPDAETYIALLASFAKIEKQIAGLPSPALRTESRLLQYLPPNAVLYGAVPNLGGTIGQAMALAEQQSVENPVFRELVEFRRRSGPEAADRPHPERDAAARRRNRLRTA